MASYRVRAMECELYVASYSIGSRGGSQGGSCEGHVPLRAQCRDMRRGWYRGRDADAG